jgi:hypothetical protein
VRSCVDVGISSTQVHLSIECFLQSQGFKLKSLRGGRDLLLTAGQGHIRLGHGRSAFFRHTRFGST